MRIDICIPAQETKLIVAECLTLSFPCEGEYGYRHWHDKCPFPEDGHGHIIFHDEGLVGRPPIPIDSSPFLQNVLEYMRQMSLISNGMFAEIMKREASLNEFRGLPPNLTERETKILADPEEWNRLLTGWGYYGS